MLEVYSPIPMHEGETIAYGISTKHLLHALLGVAFSLPVTVIAFIVFPLVGLPRFAALLIAAGFGFLFAMVPVKSRPLAQYLWITFQLALRPKVMLFDREYRIRVHRRQEKEGAAR